MHQANDTKKRILRVSEHYFRVYGYQMATIRLLSEAANVNVSAINHYFGTKENLYKCIFVNRLAQLSKQLKEVKVAYPITELAYLEVVAFTLIRFESAKQDFMALFFRELSMLPFSVCKFSILRFLKQAVSYIHQLKTVHQNLGEFRSEEKYQLYFQLLFSVHPAMRHSEKLRRFLSIASYNKFQAISERVKIK